MVEVLALRRETKISQLLNSFPIPNEALPTQEMPGWQKLLLCEKLPMHKCPFKINFSRNVVGKKIWRPHPIKAIATYDPFSVVYNFEYDPLHDPNLKKFFKKGIYEESIRFHSFTDDQNGVLCNLKAFNNFRKYLFELFLINVHRKIKETDKLEREKFDLKIIEETFHRNFMIELRKSYRRPRDDILAEIAKNRQERLATIRQNYEEKVATHEENKKLTFKYLLLKSLGKTQFIKQRQALLREKHRRRHIKLHLRFHEKFRHHRHLLQKRLSDAQQEKFQKAHERWHAQLKFRENYNNKKEILLEENEKEMQANIERRKQKLKLAMDRMNEKFMQYKADKVRKRYKHYHKENIKEALQTGIKKMAKRKRQQRKRKMMKKRRSLFSVDSNEFKSDEKLVFISEPKELRSSDASVKSSFYSITKSKNVSDVELEEIPPQEEALQKISRAQINAAVDKAFEAFDFLKSIQSNFNVIETAREIIEIFIATPDNILPFDDAVIHYAKDRARATMEIVKHEVMQELAHIIIANKDLVCGSSKSSSQSMKTCSKSVVFGQNIQKSASTETLIPSDTTLKSVKNRIPTPKTSLVNLVSMVLETDPETPEIPEESNTLELIHLSKAQKLLVERNCLLFQKLLKHSLLQRCLAAIDLRTMMVTPKVNAELIGMDIEYLINLLADSLVRLPTEDLQFGSNLLLATNVLVAQILIELRVVLYETCDCKQKSCLSCLKSIHSNSIE